VIVQSKTLTTSDPAFQAVIADTIKTVSPFKSIKNIRSPLTAGHAAQISADGRTVYGRVRHEGHSPRSPRSGSTRSPRHGKIAGRHPGFFVGEAGSISSPAMALNDAFNSRHRPGG